MKSILLKLSILGITSILSAGCISPSSQSARSAIPCEQQQGFFSELLALTNLQRAETGLSSLVISLELVEAAQVHSIDMANNNFLGHTGSDGSRPWQRAQAQGYESMFVGENVGGGYKSPADVVAGWMNSPGHRANILRPEYTEIGFGFFNNPNSQYKNYWTQKFGNRENFGSSIGDPVPRSFLQICQTVSGESANFNVLGEYPLELLGLDYSIDEETTNSDAVLSFTYFRQSLLINEYIDAPLSVKTTDHGGMLKFLFILILASFQFNRKKP